MLTAGGVGASFGEECYNHSSCNMDVYSGLYSGARRGAGGGGSAGGISSRAPACVLIYKRIKRHTGINPTAAVRRCAVYCLFINNVIMDTASRVPLLSIIIIKTALTDVRRRPQLYNPILTLIGQYTPACHLSFPWGPFLCVCVCVCLCVHLTQGFYLSSFA